MPRERDDGAAAQAETGGSCAALADTTRCWRCGCRLCKCWCSVSVTASHGWHRPVWRHLTGGAPLDWETFVREHVERRPTEQSLLYHVDLGERLRLLLIAAAYDAEAVLHARCELVEQSAPKADLYQLHRAHKRAIRQRLAPLQCLSLIHI